MTDLVDWELAERLARRLVRPGPTLSLTEAADVVTSLRTAATDALDHVVSYTGMEPDRSLRTENLVVDRGQWAGQNLAGLRTVLGPVMERLVASREQRTGKLPTAGVVGMVGRRVTAGELAAVLSFLSTKVLGQYEVFLPPEQGDGRLSLVAPNIVEVERRLEVDPADFRMWVALHEQTHHLQFTAVPWLHGHLMALVGRLADSAELDPQQLLARLRGAIGEIRSGGPDRPGGVLAVLQSPAQRAVAAEAQALMTVLEGHADFVMDAVGPQVVPSVAQIRERFEARRRRRGSPIEMLLRKILGLDAKLAQYRVGGAFFRAVDAAGGLAAVNAVWAGPDALPSAAELAAPADWLARVGTAASMTD